MRWLKFILSFVVTVSLIVFLNIKISVMPALGKFFDPFHGFWQNSETSESPRNTVRQLKGLQANVTIQYDDRMIPHIFAENAHDLYFAQGYVTAKDRLWQMEFQTHAAAGRLSEILGHRTLEYDKYQRRLGMRIAAENALKIMQTAPETQKIVEAYTAGVNAFISELSPKEYPIEYKIFDYAPEPWTPLKCALLLKYMAQMLSGYSSDLQMSNTLARFGPEVVTDLFTHYSKKMEPVIPEGTPWDFTPLKLSVPQKIFKPKIVSEIPSFPATTNHGSNNWAVAGTKTASGFPILANDPHLELNLPSIWYEIQLVSPAANVYGVSLPGAPNIILGFNQNIAWGVTNSQADVMDWYEITFKDSSLNEYLHDNKWKPTRRVMEEIKVRGGETVMDTVIYTHHGPVAFKANERPFSRRVPRLHALRWLGHEPSNEALTFYRLNHATDYDEFVEALSHYSCPAQNFVFADVNKDIAIWHNGKFPAKWPGQGKYISDGSDAKYDWQGWIPHEQNPHIKNPARGFVSSANQNATDPTYPYYLNWTYASYYRIARINQRLSEMQSIVPDDFRQLQLDTKNLHAESVLPALLKLMDEMNLSSEELKMLQELKSWDFFNDAEKIAPTIFDRWWRKLYLAIWTDEFGGEGTYYRFPSRTRTVQLILEEPATNWFDNIHTEKIETLTDLVQTTFKDTFDELVKKYGQMDKSWQRGKYKSTDIIHLARIPGFSRLDLEVGGDAGIVNAISRTHGPSWRMVVALGPEVKAWGIYPGGQSGNPGSPHYDDFVDGWIKGEVAELLFLKSEEEPNERIVSKLILEGESK